MNGRRASSPWLAVVSHAAAPHVGLAAAALLWSGNFIVGRALRGQITPLALNFWRWAIALAVQLAFTQRLQWAHRRAALGEWKRIAALGLTGIAAFHTCVYLALETTTAVNALLLLALSPLLTVFGAWALFREPVTARQLMGLAVSLAGAVVLIARGDAAHLGSLRFGTGDLWMLVAVVLWTAYSLLLKKAPAALPQPVLLTASTIAGVAWMLPAYAWRQFGEGWPQLTVGAVGGLLYVSLFASVLAFLLWNGGVARIGPQRAIVYLYLMPFFGAVLAFAFLGEGVEGYQVASGAAIFLGIALMNWRPRSA
jgi:drug/metabolite transporter (DMT)-like permease